MKSSKWIWMDDSLCENTYVEFAVPLKYDTGKAEIDISVDTEYAIYINGEYVASGQYADFPWYKIYHTVDITKCLNKGENDIRIVVWYMGDLNFCHYVNRPGLRFEIKIDGQTVQASSSETLCRKHPHLVSDPEMRKITPQQGYSFLWRDSDEGELSRATEIDGMPEELKPCPIQNLTTLKKITGKRSGNVFDFGEETVGYPYIVLRANRGDKITVAFGEWLDEGHVVRLMFDGEYDFSFDIEGSGKRACVFNPMRKIGCRYVEVIGECDIEEVSMIPLRYPFVRRNVFISDPLRKRIYDTSVKTLELNAFDHYYDCPWREQAFWTFDARFQMRYGYTAFIGFEYQRAALVLLSEDRRDDNLITMVVPSSTSNTIPSFSLSYVMAMAEYIEVSRDLGVAEKYFEKTKSVINAYLDKRECGVVPCFDGIWNFYEWKPMFNGHSGKRFDSVLNLMVCYALKKMIYICDELDRKEDSEYYNCALNDLIAATRARFYEKETGLFKSFDDEPCYSQLVNSLAILSGAASREEYAPICKILIDPSEDVTETTLSMTAFRYDALMEADKEKYSSYIINDIDSSFGEMLDEGATSFWETLLGAKDMEGTGSLCHGWSALPIYYYKELGVFDIKEYYSEKVENFSSWREDYNSGIKKFLENEKLRAQTVREEYISPERYVNDPEKYRNELAGMLGFPLTERRKTPALVKKEFVAKDKNVNIYRMQLRFFDCVDFYGLFFEQIKNKETAPFTLGIHGGGGTPEICSSIYYESGLYRHLVRRMTDRGASVFAPQLLLWNTEAFGSAYDRVTVDGKLRQLGGSITALELYMLRGSIDYFIENEGICADRVGAAGMSYGGMYTLYLTAIDDRIRSAYACSWVNDCYVHSRADWSYFNSQNRFTVEETVGLIAPRSFVVAMGERDELFDHKITERVCENARKYYQAFGAEEMLKTVIFPENHVVDIQEVELDSMFDNL